MRIFPIITALMVTLAIYFALFQRENLVVFAGGDPVSVPIETDPAGDDIGTKPPISVLVQKSIAQRVKSGIVLRGRTEAARNIDVRSETSGLVISEPLGKGSFVKRGDVLCDLDPGTRNVALIEANARLAEASINENAARNLAAKGFGSTAAATARLASLQAAEAGVQRAQKNIEKLKITAPFDGLLETDTAELGSLLQPGSLCGHIIKLDPIKFVGFVPEQDVGRVKKGAAAGARLTDGTTASGNVTFLSRSADPATRTFRVEIEVPNPDLTIRDGSTAEIFIAFANERAHLLPQSALTLDDGGVLGIRVVKGDVARFKPVKIVRDTTKGVWLSGLAEKIEVIVVGQEYVVDGRRVSVTYREAEQ